MDRLPNERLAAMHGREKEGWKKEEGGERPAAEEIRTQGRGGSARDDWIATLQRETCHRSGIPTQTVRRPSVSGQTGAGREFSAQIGVEARRVATQAGIQAAIHASTPGTAATG